MFVPTHDACFVSPILTLTVFTLIFISDTVLFVYLPTEHTVLVFNCLFIVTREINI